MSLYTRILLQDLYTNCIIQSSLPDCISISDNNLVIHVTL